MRRDAPLAEFAVEISEVAAEAVIEAACSILRSFFLCLFEIPPAKIETNEGGLREYAVLATYSFTIGTIAEPRAKYERLD